MTSDSYTQVRDAAVMRVQRRVGSTLRGKWRLERVLGVGGMAAVYAATHRNGKQVAVKVLHAELSAEREIRTRFLREGYVANRVGHAGAVSVSDDDIADDGAPFLVMDLLDGESVEARRERAGGRLDVVDVLSIVDQLLDTLTAAHAHGIVHRDIKPDNLFVTRDGAVKVLDFGIARLREGNGANGTHTGISMGTPSYMAQEQARALWSEVDARTDLWAVGATMYACLTGRVVHDGRTPNEQLLSAMTVRAPLMLSLLPDLPRSVAAVIDKALEIERGDRFQTAAAMQDAIRAAYQQMESAPISTAPKLLVPAAPPDKTLLSARSVGDASAPTGAEPRSSPGRWTLVGIAIAASVALLTVAMSVRSGRPSTSGTPASEAGPVPSVPAADAPPAQSSSASLSESVLSAPAASPSRAPVRDIDHAWRPPAKRSQVDPRVSGSSGHKGGPMEDHP